MQSLTLKIKRITVVQGRGPDTIYLEPELASPYPNLKYPASIKIDTAAGNGVTYCREVLGLEPDDLVRMPG